MVAAGVAVWAINRSGDGGTLAVRGEIYAEVGRGDDVLEWIGQRSDELDSLFGGPCPTDPLAIPFAEGDQVTVREEDGRVVATAGLYDGRFEGERGVGLGCMFQFDVDIPGSASFVTFEVGGLDESEPFAMAELKDDPEVSLRVG